MKAVTVLLILSSFLLGCSKDKSGKIIHRIKFTTEKTGTKSGNEPADTTYSRFGMYITSITPRHFFAKLNIMMYLDNWDQSNSSTHMISYIDGHDNDPNYEIFLNVDFSGNQEISYEPILYSTDKKDGLFGQKEVTFDYFYFVPYYFKLEFEVPDSYGNINILGNNGTYATDPVSGKRYLTVPQHPLLEGIFGYPNQQPFGYFFGKTDSTFVFNKECAPVSPSENHPNGGGQPMIRSNKYTPITVTMPSEGSTIEMHSIISFDTRNLIQVYAGRDNIAYTADDQFVFAPNYWERLAVKLEVR